MHQWTRPLQARISRRRTLIATGAGTLGAAFLAACGGDSGKKDGQAAGSSGLLTKPVDTTAQAKRGGVLKTHVHIDPVQGFDPLVSNHFIALSRAAFSYSRLLKFTLAKYPESASLTVTGDLAESYELSPDKLTLTMKMRPGVTWDRRPPTNNRALSTDDVMFSWDKFRSVTPSRADLVYQASPTAPIESLTSPDSRTLVFKIKAPDVGLLPLLATWDHLTVMPRESDSGFDPRVDIRGSGPYMLDRYVPSSGFSWVRNPDYYVKDRPFPDRVEEPIVTEVSQRLAQFRTGAFYQWATTNTPVGLGLDILDLKRDAPATVLSQDQDYLAVSGGQHMLFGYDGDSPWKDLRMRQALSMTVDRDAMVDAATSRDKFIKEGLDMPWAQNTAILPGWSGYWLDPKNEKEFGPSAKNLSYNLPEAKKLMAAAGHANGAEVRIYFVTQFHNVLVQIMAGMYEAGGFKVKQEPLTAVDHMTKYYAGYAGGSKGFNGLSALSERPFATAVNCMFSFWHKDSGIYKGASPNGTNVERGDPALNEMLDKMRAEFDAPKQQSLAKDAQRRVAEMVYHIPNAGIIKGLNLTWPALANFGVYNIFDSAVLRGPGSTWQERDLNLWIDETKAPLKA